MRFAWAIVLCLGVIWTGPRASWGQDIRPRLLVQARASDAAGEVLFDAIHSAQSRVDALRQALDHPGHFAGARPVASQPIAQQVEKQVAAARKPPAAKTPTYRDLFDHAVGRILKDKDHTTDPSFDNLTDDALFQEMTTLQLYNLRQFMRLSELRKESESLKRQIQSMPREKGTPSTQPAIASFNDLLSQVDARIAGGQRGPQWSKLRRKLHNAVAARMESQGIGQFSGQQSQAQPYVPAPVSAPLDDPRFQRWYYGPQDPFTGWVDPFADPFGITGGGGFYNRSDTRVNIDPDTRTNSVFDRRVNIDNDRRLNVHEDPRENF